MLRAYAAEQGYTVCGEYADDGWSGTTFDRPGFCRMIADVEAKKIDLVITKDLSRLGRDYITAGQYTELYFPSKGVRCIAVNDGYDSDGPYTDIAPFKNVLNEMYARDTSKKIRSAFAAKIRKGAYIAAFAPYGYQKDPADKHHLVVDAQSGRIVKRMFRLAANGAPPAEIARTLNAQGVPPPAVYRCLTHTGQDADARSRKHAWTGATIAKMLRNVVYLGHVAQGKTTKVSFKSRLTVHNPRDQWIVVKHTHEALVDEETFVLARRRTAARTCQKTGAFHNLFSGVVRCADCGRSMSATGTRKKGSPAVLVCGGYKLRGAGACSNHFIDYNALYAVVLASLKEQLALSGAQHAAVLDGTQKRLPSAAARQGGAAEQRALQKRLRALECILGKLYEDNAAGRLSDARMHTLLQKYEREAAALEARLAALEAADEPPCRPEPSAREKLDGLLCGLTDCTELTPALLCKLIDRIEIGQGRYEKGAHGKEKRQTIKICYRFQTQATMREHAL